MVLLHSYQIVMVEGPQTKKTTNDSCIYILLEQVLPGRGFRLKKNYFVKYVILQFHQVLK